MKREEIIKRLWTIANTSEDTSIRIAALKELVKIDSERTSAIKELEDIAEYGDQHSVRALKILLALQTKKKSEINIRELLDDDELE